MTLKKYPKFEEKLTFYLKNDMKNFGELYSEQWKV